MRENKFRGKRTDNGEWVYGCLITGFFLRGGKDIPYIMTADGTDYDCFEDITEENGIFEVIPETVGQFTGLKDKNGKEIYEGDIIQFNNNKVDLCQVCFGEFPVYDMETEEVTDTACGWYAKVIFTDALSQLEPFCYDRVINKQWIGTLEIEVIGNIYDNPELLEVSE